MVFFDHNRLLRQSLLLMAATQIGNAANMLFQIVMMRSLKVEYGSLATMLSLVLILATPLEALRTAMAHFAARLCQAGSAGQIWRLTGNWGKILAGPAVALVLIGIIFSRPLAGFFHLPSSAIIVVTGVVMALTLFMPVLAGAVQGAQAFGWFALVGQSWSIIRLITGTILVIGVSATAVMGMVSQGLGVLVSVAVGGLGLQMILKGRPDQAQALPDSFQYFIKSLVILTGFAVLMNADVALVKHYFTPEQADVFARAATLARAIIFLPMPIAAVMFPKVVADGVEKVIAAEDWTILRRAIGYVAVLVVVMGLVASLSGGLLWRIFNGVWPEAASLQLFRLVMWAMAPLGLTFLLVNFELAQHRFQIAWITLPCAAAYLVGVALWHQALWQVAAVLAGVSMLSLVLLAGGLLLKKH